MAKQTSIMAKRFRGYLPVVIDVETGGLNPKTDALLEVALVTLAMDDNGVLHPNKTHADHVIPFANANLDPEALAINKIDPYHPFRFAIPEPQAIDNLFQPIEAALKEYHCQRAVLVGHNAWFDLFFIKAAVKRCGLKKMPLHAFTTFDTATLSALAFGQTVLARAAKCAGLRFDRNKAHSAIYDAEITADIFCHIINHTHYQPLPAPSHSAVEQK